MTVRHLFEPLPVRRREFLRNLKRDYGRLLHLLQAYALVSVGVRLSCSNQSGQTCATLRRRRRVQDRTGRDDGR